MKWSKMPFSRRHNILAKENKQANKQKTKVETENMIEIITSKYPINCTKDIKVKIDSI